VLARIERQFARHGFIQFPRLWESAGGSTTEDRAAGRRAAGRNAVTTHPQLPSALCASGDAHLDAAMRRSTATMAPERLPMALSQGQVQVASVCRKRMRFELHFEQQVARG